MWPKFIYTLISLLTQCSLFRQSAGQLNCCWPSPAQSFLASSVVEIHDQDFCSCVLDVGPPLWRGEGSVCPCRRYICCTAGNSVPDWLLNGFWPSPAQWFLVLSPMGLMTILYSLTALGAFSLSPQPGGSGPCICVPQWQGDPVLPPGTEFPFRHLLRLAGLRWWYSNPPPHRDLGSRVVSDLLSISKPVQLADA
jgi:hypothetical protein